MRRPFFGRLAGLTGQVVLAHIRGLMFCFATGDDLARGTRM